MEPKTDDQRRQDALKKLRVRVQEMWNLESEIDGLVAVLKSPDFDGRCLATWTEVGEALGISRQAAQQRYSGFSWAGSTE